MRNKVKSLSVLLSVILTFNLIFVTAFGYVTKRPEFPEKTVSYKSASDAWFDDFISYDEGAKPLGLTLNEPDGTSIDIVSVKTPDYKSKNVLRVSKTKESSNVYFNVPVPEFEKSFTFITRFMYNGEDAVLPFRLTGGAPSNSPNFITQTAKEYLRYRNTSPAYYLQLGEKTNIEKDVWYTLTIKWDYETRTTSMTFQGDTYKNKELNVAAEFKTNRTTGTIYAEALPWNTTFTDDSVKYIRFSTDLVAGSGSYYFDYMKILTDSSDLEFEKEVVEKLPYNTIDTPVLRPLSGIINISINGEYHFFVNKPYFEGESLMIKAKDFAKINGMLYMVSGETITMKNDKNEIVINKNSDSATVNGKTVKLSEPINKNSFVPLFDLTKTLGIKTNFNSDTNTLEITK